MKGDPVLYHIVETTYRAGVPLTRLGECVLLYSRTTWFAALIRRCGPRVKLTEPDAPLRDRDRPGRDQPGEPHPR